MGRRHLRTIDIARDLGVHVNTVRLYEMWGYFSEIPRGKNGYRQFSELHLEQARLAHLTLRWPYVGEKDLLVSLVKSAARGELSDAMEQAYKYLARVRMEITSTESAIEFLECWAAGHIRESVPQKMHITQAAQYLDVTVDMLRNWERNGLITIPRDPTNGYRLYGAIEFGRVRIIRTLLQSGYSLMAILQMLVQFDKGHTENLRDTLEIPRHENDCQEIEIIADHWHSSLLELEQRAQAIIRQIRHLFAMTQ